MGMRLRNNPASARVVLAMFPAILTGCIVIPQSVDATVEAHEEVRLNEDILVSVGPRRLLDNIAQNISKLDRGITIVDSLAFRDTAFPEGGWRLSDLIEPAERRLSVAAALDVGYLVLLGPASLEEMSDEKGGMVWPLGAVSGKETSTLSAVVIDLSSGRALSQLAVSASGTYHAVLYIYPAYR